MGSNKLLLPYRGRSLLCAALDAVAGSRAEPVICVLGRDAEAVRRAMEKESGPRPVVWIVNADAAWGRASSIRAALKALPEACEAALFLPGDVPGVTATEVDALIARFESTHAEIVVAVEDTEAPSHPVLFARSLFSELRALQGDVGGRALIEKRWASVEKVQRKGPSLFDVDTPEDYKKLLEGLP